MPQTETGVFESVRYVGELVEEGWSIHYLFGRRAYVDRRNRALLSRRRYARFSHAFGTDTLEVRFGGPIYRGAKSDSEITEQVEDSVRRL